MLPVASPWFFAGGRPGHLKAITRPPQGVGGGRAKANQRIRKLVHLSKGSTVLWPKKSTFWEQFLNFFLNTYFKIQNFQFYVYGASPQIQWDFRWKELSTLEIDQKSLQNYSRSRRTFWNRDESSCKFFRKSTIICERISYEPFDAYLP